jgi:hypothetical protein
MAVHTGWGVAAVLSVVFVLALVAPVSAEEVYQTVFFPQQDLQFQQAQGYDVVYLPDGGVTSVPGAPMLPNRTLRIALPDGMRATGVRVVNTDAVTLPGQYNMYPAQPVKRMQVPATGFVPQNEAAYASAEAYPGVLAELAGQTDLAGQAMALVCFSPLQYVPATGTLTLHTSIEIVIEGEPGYVCGDYLPTGLSAWKQAEQVQRVRDMVINPEAVHPQESTWAPTGRALDPGNYEYVIITIYSWRSFAEPLADWKTQKGVPTAIMDTSTIYAEYSGADYPERIRAFIIDAHNTWGAEYFLLAGDTNLIPAPSRTFTVPDPEPVVNDTYYADFDDDWTCEVNVGRASARYATDLDVFIDKALTYEQNPPMTDYPTKVGFFGFDAEEPGSGEGEDCKFLIDLFWIPDDWDLTTVYDSDQPSFHKPVVIACMNEGNNILNHIDHGDTNVMGTGSLTNGGSLNNSDMEGLTNGDRQSILYSTACKACDYDAYTCIAEAFVKNPNGGGVAFVGNSGYGWYQPGELDYWSLRFDRNFFRSLMEPTENHYRLGDLFSDHKNDSYINHDTYRYIFVGLTLLGDPDLPIWTDTPAELVVDHSPTMAAGQPNNFEVSVTSGGTPVDGARVCLLKSGDVYEIGYTSGGTVSFNVTPAEVGSMQVTTTAQNCLPETTTVAVTEGGLVLGDVNGDGFCDNFDIAPFVYAILHSQTLFEIEYSNGCYWCADCNESGAVDNFDISPFISILTSP